MCHFGPRTGSVDPIRDLAIISEELRLKDIQNLKREMEGHISFLKRNSDKIKREELVRLR